ncbi:glutamate receptor ionotropic, kainate glr-3-like [Macrobrachium nipponense]|uniref:glutamate receptor ionotropic, kainate glr-3-like n=1 Tax=Macrobrachium nipponense TaxID=159736 RepID=UPI0030C7FD52
MSEATKDVFDSSKAEGYSVTILSDGTINAKSFLKFSRNLERHAGITTFVFQSGDEVTPLASGLRTLHRSSKQPYIIVTSDNIDFLTSAIGSLYRGNLLVWSTRLLVITRLPIHQIHSMRESLSNINAMVMVATSENGIPQCKIYLYIPYSHRCLEVAKWVQHKRLTFQATYGMFQEKFKKLADGAHLEVTAEIYPPLILSNTRKKAGGRDPTKILRGPLIEVLSILASSINFTCSWTRPTDVAFGYQFPNGSWGGMVGMVARRDKSVMVFVTLRKKMRIANPHFLFQEVDFSFLIFTVLYKRAQVVDYTLPLTFTYARFLARKGRTEIRPFGFFEPLDTTVWYSLLGGVVIMMAASIFVSRVLPMSPRMPLKDSPNDYVRVFLGQDTEKASEAFWSLKLLVGVWMVAMSIVTRSYSGNLNSLLTVRYVPQPYHSVKAVAQDPSVKIVTEIGGYYHQSIESGFFKEITDAGKQAMISYVEFTDFEEVVDTKIAKGGYVLMNDDLPNKMLIDQYFSKTGTCIFYQSKEYFFPQISAMIAPKYSPLIPVLNERLVMIIESGLYEQWLKREYLNSSSCDKAPTKILVQSSLSFYNIWGMFVLLVSGFAVSLVAFVLEILTAKTVICLQRFRWEMPF